jgi:DNA-binding Xre family transcriptional regulator
MVDAYALSEESCAMSIKTTETGTSLSERVAEEVRAMMARRRMTGAALAKVLNVSAAWVSYRITGKQPIDLNDLEQIAEALGCRPGDLLPRSAASANGSLTGGYPRPAVRPIDNRPPARGRQPTIRRPTRIGEPSTISSLPAAA